MADFSTVTPVPGLTTAYTSVLSIINDKFTDLARGLDTSPATNPATATNIPTNGIAWSSTLSKWRKWDGTAWQDLSTLYAINISGNAATATTATTATTASSITNGVYTIGNQSIAGVKTFSEQVRVSNGSVTAPSIAFNSDGATDTGFYWTADGFTNFTNNGVYSGSIQAGGNLLMVGNITAYGSTTAPSDIRIKTNIRKIDNALDKVVQLSGITYDRTDIECSRQTGVIAQEVQKVLPEAIIVLDDPRQTLTVAYGNLVGLLIEAIKELKSEIDILKTKVN
jgi:hypothetical protein